MLGLFSNTVGGHLDQRMFDNWNLVPSLIMSDTTFRAYSDYTCVSSVQIKLPFSCYKNSISKYFLQSPDNWQAQQRNEIVNIKLGTDKQTFLLYKH